MSPQTFDYIIAGGGLAGLSLAHRINRSLLRDRRLLIIDREEKVANDHTWCFWSDADVGFEDIVFHRWKKLGFFTFDGEQLSLDIGSEGFEYRMVRASDFYSYVIPKLRDCPSVEFLTADILDIRDGEVETSKGNFEARKMVFDSVSVPGYDESRDHNLLQHFLGWNVETEEDAFDPSEAVLFDFRVQQIGECRFIYVLPVSPREALVEFTIFSGSLLEEEEYESNLKDHLENTLGLGEYRIIGRESGVIPMSDAVHDQRPSEKIVRIGTAGGWVKPSTGYSFKRSQQRTEAIVRALESDSPVPVFGSRWKNFLDSVLLDVLEKGTPPAAEVFERLFRRNPSDRVLRFLDEDASVSEDLRLMSTVELGPFTRSALLELARRIRK
ncbi:MAG: lycopene cyclase [Acidobacteriota bacterium]|nr:MAG: lycopene cyclase [Acidobacteriota bacterium]